MFYIISGQGNIGPFKTFGSAKSWMKKMNRTGDICPLIDPAFEVFRSAAGTTGEQTQTAHAGTQLSQNTSLNTEPKKPSPK